MFRSPESQSLNMKHCYILSSSFAGVVGWRSSWKPRWKPSPLPARPPEAPAPVTAVGPASALPANVDPPGRFSSVLSFWCAGWATAWAWWLFPCNETFHVIRYTAAKKRLPNSGFHKQCSPHHVLMTVITHLSSPTMINGSLWLKAIRDSLFFRLDTTACTQIALYLFTLRSNTNTLPSVVTAANTVLE